MYGCVLVITDSREELKVLNSQVHSALERECEEKGIQLLLVELLWGNLQQETQQHMYNQTVNHILTETADAILVVSAGKRTDHQKRKSDKKAKMF